MNKESRHFARLGRGALILFVVCSLSVSALGDGNLTPVATSVSTTTSGTATLITIAATAPMAYAVKRPNHQSIVVELPNVDTSRLARVYRVKSPLVSQVAVESLGGSNTSRLRVSLLGPTRDRSQLADNKIVIELTADQPQKMVEGNGDSDSIPPPAAVPAQRADEDQAPMPTPAPSSVAATPVVGSAPSDAPQQQGRQYGQPGFVGEPINLNVVNADVRDILNYITEQYGVNFVIDSSVGAVPVTVNVTDVPWNIALDAILKANRLGIDVQGNILRVATIQVLATEAAAQEKIRDAQLDNSLLVTEFLRLNYARASGNLAQTAGATGSFTGGASQAGATGAGATSGGDQGILPIISRRLSRRGSVEVDGRSNTIIITDVRENIDAIRQLVVLLDQPEPQVEIETRIVVASRNFSRDLGVQLAAVALNPSRGGMAAFNTAPNDGTSGRQAGGIPGGLIGSPQPTTGPNSLGAAAANTVIGLTTGLFGTAQISALITAAESKGQAKVVATPRVTVLNNRPAEIESGTQIPVVTPQGGGAIGGALVFTTEYISVPLRLSITPQITDAGTVVLRVVAENNSVNLALITAGGTPGIDTQRMQTEVLVPDGGTTVVGGVLADNESETQTRTPGLSSIPILGNLFKRRATTRSSNEILFFITPRIYRPDYFGRPTTGTISSGNRSVQLPQPVPLGNPPTNTPTPQQLQQQTPQRTTPTGQPQSQTPEGPRD